MLKIVTTAAVAGAVASLALVAPAVAAAAPTLATPPVRTGFGPVTLTGTATPGATVQLYETAMFWNDMAPAEDWANGGGPVTAKADGNGRFTITRQQDSGFYWQVVSGGVRSAVVTARIRVRPAFTLTAAGAGRMTARVAADPAQPGLPVRIERSSGGAWTTVASGSTSDPAADFAATIAGPAGTYRAYIGADDRNGVLANYSTPIGHGTPVTTTAAVRFTRIQYRAKSLNGEWFQLTNKSAATAALKGWAVRDAAGHTYTFRTTTNLGAGRSIVVHTGSGRDTALTRYWGSRAYIWNDGGDTATLRTAAGKAVDTCKYGSGSGATDC